MFDLPSLNKNNAMIDSKRISFFEYIYVFVLIIYAGNANTFIASTSFTERPIGFFLPVVLSIILTIRFNILFNKNFYLLIFCYFIYFIAITIKYNIIHPTIFLNFSFVFFVVYVTVKALRFNLFIIYENLLYYLAIFGLLMWGIQILLGGDTLYYFLSKSSSIDSFSQVSSGGLSVIFYSVQPHSASVLFDFLPPRNCGFAWEPGGFAVYLCLAIYINLFITNKNGNSKYRLWVLLLALISTQSTTGYIILIIIILFYLLNNNLKIILLLLPFIIAVLVFIFSLPFMSNKIVSLVTEAGKTDIMVEQSIGREAPIVPQRFASFIIALRDFYYNPILGTGGIKGKSWIEQIGGKVIPISGIGNILAWFGLIGFLFFIIISYKTSVFFSEYFQYNGKILFFLIILLISISYSIVIFHLIMCFWMFQLFDFHDINNNEQNIT